MIDRRTAMTTGAAFALGAGGLNGGSAKGNSMAQMHVPAEEAPHDRCFMQWPVSRRVYRDSVFLEMVQTTIARIANSIAEFEPVVMLADPAQHAQARQYLSGAVDLWDVPTEDLWCRDSGPLFAIDPDDRPVISKIQFNGWGRKQTHKHDSKVAKRVADILSLPMVETGLIGEPGGVETDGHGLLMAHESSWVNENRNPGLDRAEIGRRLQQAYGAETLLWSPGVWGEDITDYHIDSLARFTGPGRVLMNLPDRPDRRDPFHRAALQTHDRLVAADLQVDVIPEPNRPRVRSRDFVASYANYYVANGAVIAAQFGDPETDAIAAQALARHYPGRDIVTLNVDPLGELGGGIHCATQQMPST